VSRARGQDGDGFGLHSKPYRSISYALQQAREGSTVYLDGTGTASSPYTCESFDAKHSGVLLEKSVSVIGINSSAHISCNHGNNWLVNGAGAVNKNKLRVLFKNLAFQNTSVLLLDASLHVKDCAFNRTEATAISISLVNQSRFKLSLDSVVFEQNKACLLLTSKTNKRNKIFVSITNSNIKSNGLKNLNIFRGQDSIFFFNASNDKIEITINNSSFVGNFLQTKSTNERHADLIHVENELGECNVSVQHSQFENNGLHESISQTNNLFFLKSSILFATVRSSHVVNSKSARFLYFTGKSSHVSVHNTTFRNFTILKKDFHNGGVFSINALKTCYLFIQDCFINKGKITTDINGGIAYVDALNVNITIQSSFVGHVTTNGNGGVFHIEEVDTAQLLSGSQLTFFTSDTLFHFNQAGDRGGVLFASSRDITTLTFHNVSFVKNKSKMDGSTICLYDHSSLKKSYLSLDVTDTLFLQNQAAWSKARGVIYFDTSDVTVVNLHNVSFVRNRAFAGGAIYAQNINASLFKFIVTESSFIGNMALGSRAINVGAINVGANNGGAINVAFWSNESTMVLNSSVFIQNKAKGSHGGAIFIGINPKHFANVYIVNCTFENNSATYGGAVAVPENSQIMLICKDSVFKSNEVFTYTMHARYVLYNPFYTSYGGAMFLSVTNSTISFMNTTFMNNICSANQGGAVYIETSNSTTFNVTNTLFMNNTALNDLGGAIALVMAEDQIEQSGCMDPVTPVPQRSWTCLNRASFQDVKFIGNIAFSGSALFVINGEMVLNNCKFVNNFALAQAGHLSTDGSNNLTIHNTIFRQTSGSVLANKIEFPFTSFIQTFSGGPLNIRNSTFDQCIIFDDHPLIVVTLGGDIDLDKFTSVSCAVGSNITKTDASFTKWESPLCNRRFSSLRLSCKQCESKYYSLQRGNIKGLKETNNFKCNSCPRGADCLPTIKSKPNFWGYFESYYPPTLAFTFCPVGYCKSPDRNTKEYNGCHGHRTGMMCGSCSDEYTEELFSTKCHLAEDCNDHWFWVAFVALVFLLASFLVFKIPLPGFVINQTLWFRRSVSTRTDSNNQDSSNTFTTNEDEQQSTRDISEQSEESTSLPPTQETRNERNQTSGFLEIIFYYYQIAYLLLNSYWLEQLLSTKFVTTFVAFFNFRPNTSGLGLTCPFPGLTPLTKKIFEISPVFATLVAIWIIFGIRCTISLARRRRPSPQTSFLPPYLAATIETLLLGYAAIANVSFSLVRCVSIGSETRWFYNGNVACFQWWQYMALVFNLVFVVPFMLTLAWASLKVQKGKLTARELLLSTLFPLPLLFRWVLQAVKSFRQNENEAQQPSASLDAMKLVLSGPFRKLSNTDNGAVYWQSIMIARRFVLVLLYTFIPDPTLRLFFMTLFNVLVLFHHVSVKPFQNPFANSLESVSLLVLITLGLINMHKSVYVGVEAHVKGDLVQIFQAYDWFEIIVLGFLPAVFLLIISLGFMSLVVRILLRFCHCLMTNLSRLYSYCCTSIDTTYERLR
jgi:predicted outer membrane repeat protein